MIMCCKNIKNKNINEHAYEITEMFEHWLMKMTYIKNVILLQ